MAQVIASAITFGVVLVTIEKISEVLIMLISMTTRFFKQGGMT